MDPDAHAPAVNTEPAPACPLGWRRWWCPLRALIFAQVVATIVTGGQQLFRRVGAYLSGDYFWFQGHWDTYWALEKVGALAFLTSPFFPLVIWWTARSRGVVGREFAYLLIATLTLSAVQFLAALPLVQ